MKGISEDDDNPCNDIPEAPLGPGEFRYAVETSDLVSELLYRHRTVREVDNAH